LEEKKRFQYVTKGYDIKMFKVCSSLSVLVVNEVLIIDKAS